MRWFPRFRFRLATLLIGTTVLCVWLGAAVDKAHKQERAVEVVERLDGLLLFDYHLGPDGEIDGPMDLWRSPTGPLWGRAHIGEEYFRTLVGLGVNAEYCPPSAADLDVICRVRSLKLLYVEQPSITDAALIPISTLPKLEALRLDDTTVTDDGLRSLGRLRQLRSLSLSRTRITDGGLRHLQELQSLRRLNLSGTAMTSAGLAFIAKIGSLEELSLVATGVDDHALSYLQRLDHLEKLDVQKSAMTDSAIASLRESLPRCRIIWGR
jgi:Leucine-rich repeat (LRR) protein